MTYPEAIPGAARGKLLGVCARLADTSGTAALPVRVVAVAAMLLAFKLTVVAYCVAAIIFRLERR